MREAGFRRSASQRLSGHAQNSYASNCRLIEGIAAISLDVADLSDDALAVVARRLLADSVSWRERATACLPRLSRRYREDADTGSMPVVLAPVRPFSITGERWAIELDTATPRAWLALHAATTCPILISA